MVATHWMVSGKSSLAFSTVCMVRGVLATLSGSELVVFKGLLTDVMLCCTGSGETVLDRATLPENLKPDWDPHGLLWEMVLFIVIVRFLIIKSLHYLSKNRELTTEAFALLEKGHQNFDKFNPIQKRIWRTWVNFNGSQTQEWRNIRNKTYEGH